MSTSRRHQGNGLTKAKLLLYIFLPTFFFLRIRTTLQQHYLYRNCNQDRSFDLLVKKTKSNTTIDMIDNNDTFIVLKFKYYIQSNKLSHHLRNVSFQTKFLLINISIWVRHSNCIWFSEGFQTFSFQYSNKNIFERIE